MINKADAALDYIDKAVEPSRHDIDRYKARADEVAKALTRSQVCTDCLLVGSVARSTAVRGYSDVDLLAIIGTDNATNDGPRHAIAALGEALTSVGMATETDQFVASAKFEIPPAVDVMPAIAIKGGSGYFIPAGRNDDWQPFSPGILEERTRQSVRSLGPHFASTVRLAKFWNFSHNAGIGSSDLEELTSIALEGEGPDSSQSRLLSRVLKYCARWIGGDSATCEEVGRIFPTGQAVPRILELLNDSIALILAMQNAPSEEAVRHLTEEFFGGELAEHVH